MVDADTFQNLVFFSDPFNAAGERWTSANTPSNVPQASCAAPSSPSATRALVPVSQEIGCG